MGFQEVAKGLGGFKGFQDGIRGGDLQFHLKSGISRGIGEVLMGFNTGYGVLWNLIGPLGVTDDLG